MIAFFRKLGWLAQRRSKEERTRGRTAVPPGGGSRRAPGRRHVRSRKRAGQRGGNWETSAWYRKTLARAWSWTLLEQLVQDLRYAARTMLRNPAFTVLAALSLALGIGANTAIYSFMDALLMRSLPVADPESLVVLKWHITAKTRHGSHGGACTPAATSMTIRRRERRRRSSRSPPLSCCGNRATRFPSLFAYRPAGKLNVMVGQQAEITGGEYVSGDYFRGLGIVPAAGRLISGDDDRAGAPAVVVLSYGFAQSAIRRRGQRCRADGADQQYSVHRDRSGAAGVFRSGSGEGAGRISSVSRRSAARS